MSQGRAGQKRPKLKAGDVLAVPRRQGGYYFVIYIASTRFGDAFGLFSGHEESPDIPPSWAPAPIRFPIYSGKALVANGRWKRVGNRPDLLGFFPESPPIYHRKADNLSNPGVGEHGSAETPSGALTALTEFEAGQIGLTHRGGEKLYRQIMLEEELEEHLQSTLG